MYYINDFRIIIIGVVLLVLLVILIVVLFGLLYRSIKNLKCALDSQNRNCGDEIAGLKQSLESLKTSIAGLELKNLLDKVSAYDKKLEIVKCDIKNFNSKCNDLEVACKSFRQDLIAARGELASLRKRVLDICKGKSCDNIVTADCAFLLDKVEIIEVTLSQLMSQSNDYDIVNMKSDLNSLICRISDFSDSLRDMENDKVNVTRYVKSVSTRVTSMLDDMSSRIESVERKIDDLH